MNTIFNFQGKPEQPSITIVPVRRTGVTITWSKPSPDVLYYIVKYTKEGWNQWIKTNRTGSLLTFELKDLEPGKYTVQLIAVNEYGESSPSENKTFTIPAAFTTSPAGKILINIVSSHLSFVKVYISIPCVTLNCTSYMHHSIRPYICL